MYHFILVYALSYSVDNAKPQTYDLIQFLKRVSFKIYKMLRTVSKIFPINTKGNINIL